MNELNEELSPRRLSSMTPAITLLACLAILGHAEAQALEGGPMELRKLTSLGVTAAVVKCDGIEQKLIAQDVNTKLLVAGIKIDSGAVTSAVHGIVGASLLCFPYQDSRQAFYIELTVFRPVLIRTDGNVGPSTLSVWRQNQLVSCDPSACPSKVRSVLLDLTDKLIADYQAGNPK
jgi:hypothetical protein